jgi:hypothetical protein
MSSIQQFDAATPTNATDPVPLAEALDYMTQAWDRGWHRGLTANWQDRAEVSPRARSRAVVVVGIVAAVVVAAIALIIIAAAVGGYLDGLQAFDALKSAVAR